MTDNELVRKIAYNEFLQDQLTAEMQDLDALLRATGFPRGVESVREVAQEMLEEGQLGLSEME